MIVNLVSFSQKDTAITQFDIPPAKIQLPMPVFINPPEPEASYPGGVQEMKKFIANNIIYPQEAIEKGYSEKVYVQAIVTETGALDSIKVRRGKYDVLNQEALRVMHIMPNWVPAQWKGKFYKERIILPITFTLTGSGAVSSGTQEFTDSLDFDGKIAAGYARGEAKLQEDINDLLIFDNDEYLAFDTLKVAITIGANCKFISSEILSKDTSRHSKIQSLLVRLDSYSAGLENNNPINSQVIYTIKIPKHLEIKPNESDYGHHRCSSGIIQLPINKIEIIKSETPTLTKAEFPGGEKAIKKYFKEYLRYPNCNEQGKVYVEFLILKDGSISQTRIIRGVNRELNKEAKRLVNNMPNWIPARLDGKPVNVKVRLPVTFELN